MDERQTDSMNNQGKSAYGLSRYRHGDASLPIVSILQPLTAVQDLRLRQLVLPLYIASRQHSRRVPGPFVPHRPAPPVPPQPTRPAPTAPPAADTTTTITTLANNTAETPSTVLPAKTQPNLTMPAHNTSELTEAEGTIFEVSPTEIHITSKQTHKCKDARGSRVDRGRR